MPIDPKVGALFQFDNPALAAGADWHINLRNEPHNGQDRWFTPYLPMDGLKVYNRDVDNEVTVMINGRYPLSALPDTIEPFDFDAGIRYWTATNEGSTTIAAGDVTIAVTKDPWNADKAARAKGTSPWPARALNDLIPGGINL